MQNLFYASMAATFMTLLTAALPLQSQDYAKVTKIACLLSLLPALIFINSGLTSITTSFNWTTSYFNLQISFLFDFYSTMFIPVTIFITFSILRFANWYMSNDPALPQFLKYLLLFLITMLTMVTANNMLQLFIGWEGVGVMSFLLIGWWYSRLNANSAALQAIIYNRIGDIGLILVLSWLAITLNSWETQQMFSHQKFPILPLLGLILAAMGKSAQIGLHPWLPAAMEGPTPVSALLHSSTMVVAGVFLLIRLSPILQTNQTAITTCLYLGTITTTFTAICALTQNDIKKIIAFSTSSQLGLMMVCIGLNQPELAFLHIMMHAFFKALLFLCSGSLIHNLDEQDIRKMGGMQKLLPITTSCMTLGSLALMGTPFLAGFYSKDVIIEAINTSYLNAWTLMMALISTSLTAAYSFRIIFYVQMNTPRHPPLTPLNENNPNQTRPMIQLAVGSTTMGLLMTSTTLLNKTQTLTMPTTMKLSTLLASLLGLTFAAELASYTMKLKYPRSKMMHTFTSNLGFFNTLVHRAPLLASMKMGQHAAFHLADSLWYETLAPKAVSKAHVILSTKLSNTQKGTIKTYLAIFITTVLISLFWTILHHT